MSRTPSAEFLTVKQFADAVRRGPAPRTVVRAPFGLQAIKAPDADAPASRVLPFVLSTEQVDRENEVIAQDGWRLAEYLRNPVVLWAHDRWNPPVARAIDVRVEQGVLRAGADFVPAAIDPFAEQVFQLYRTGFLRAVSVGFIPKRWEWMDVEGGKLLRFVEQELFEFSCVTIPCNSDALLDAEALAAPPAEALAAPPAVRRSLADKGAAARLRDLDLRRRGA